MNTDSLEEPRRNDGELRDQSVHVLWEFRQCAFLARHIYDRRRSGVSELIDPLDAAALEAFCLHSRALEEFLWRDRSSKGVHKNDALAVDWFESETWRPEEVPAALQEMRDRTGWGVAHISYTRIAPKKAWGWDHDAIFHHIASRFALFASDVSPTKVISGFERQAREMNIDLRQHKSDTSPVFERGPGEMPVATPMHPTTWMHDSPRP